MILSKSKLKLLLFSILTLAIISCGDQSKAKTTSVTVSIDTPKSISRGVLGTYPDITDIILDISDANGKYYAKGRQFTKVTDGVDFVWTTTVDNVPVNLDLNFTASAYDINETKIFKGRTGKKLTLQSAAVFINLFPISNGIAPSIPEIRSVVPVENGVLLHIEDDVSDKVQYQVSPDNFKNSTGIIPVDDSGKGIIHLVNKDGLFSDRSSYNITLNNQIGGVLETTFVYKQSSDANITIGIAPTVNGIKFKKIGNDKLQVELSVSDDKDISDLSYSWSFNGNSNIDIDNNAINPIIINNFNDDTKGTLVTIVTDKHNLTYTHEYNITVNQFKADIEFKVSSTSVDDNKIFVNESIDIVFNKEIREDEINTNSININNGIKSVPGSFTFPSTNKKKVVFTPSTPWKTDKNYNLNITAKVLDTNGHKLIPVVVEFTAQTPIDKRSCKAILESNSGSSDGIYSIDPDGNGSKQPVNVYCDMTTDGGGLTRVYKKHGFQSLNSDWAVYQSGRQPKDFLYRGITSITEEHEYILIQDMEWDTVYTKIDNVFLDKLYRSSDRTLNRSYESYNAYIEYRLSDTPDGSDTERRTIGYWYYAGNGKVHNGVHVGRYDIYHNVDGRIWPNNAHGCLTQPSNSSTNCINDRRTHKGHHSPTFFRNMNTTEVYVR